jgi:hypothetical protein
VLSYHELHQPYLHCPTILPQLQDHSFVVELLQFYYQVQFVLVLVAQHVPLQPSAAVAGPVKCACQLQQ